jgi:hypothetical protein
MGLRYRDIKVGACDCDPECVRTDVLTEDMMVMVVHACCQNNGWELDVGALLVGHSLGGPTQCPGSPIWAGAGRSGRNGAHMWMDELGGQVKAEYNCACGCLRRAGKTMGDESGSACVDGALPGDRVT